MNTIVFQKETKTIDELYIPLTIVQNGKKNNNRVIIDENLKNIFYDPIKILIIDSAGMGKSTLVKFLSNFCIKKRWSIPFLIELRKLERGQSIESFIVKEIQLDNEKITGIDIKELLKRGDFIFFFDGYDEILEEDKSYITKEIRLFLTYASQNSFVLTSREDDYLSEFGDFKKYHIKDLTSPEAFELIRKYDNYGEKSKELINEIKNNENYNALHEFLGNPLMVSLLYLTFQYKNVLHYKKHIFYRQVYDALFDRHDTTKGLGAVHKKKSKLDIEEFRKILCAIGFISLKTGKIEYERDEILKLINDSMDIFPEIKTNANDYLYDILHTVPLFIEEGLNYKWAHKSFAEYFAAVFICQECKNHENKLLKDICKSENNQKYYNMLDFCYDIDYNSVLDNIITPVLQGYVNLYNTTTKGNFDLWEIDMFYRYIDNIFIVKYVNSNTNQKASPIEDYIQAVKLLTKQKIENYNYLSSLSKNDNIIIAIQRKPSYEIIKLLFHKNMDIFKEVRVKEYSLKFLKKITEVGIYKLFTPDLDILSIPEYYNSLISRVYHNNIDFKGFILDAEKCQKKLIEITTDKEKISNDFFSLF